MKTVDRIFGILLILATCGHIVGTVLWTEPMSGIFVWSLGAALGGLVLGALNVVRAGRTDDRTLAAITTLGTGGWFLLALTFGLSIHHVLDPRPLAHMSIAAVLILCGIRTLARSTTASRAAERA